MGWGEAANNATSLTKTPLAQPDDYYNKDLMLIACPMPRAS
jgi:hypothetical protein